MFPLSCAFLANSWPTVAGSHCTSSHLGLWRSFHEFVVADRGKDGACVPRCADARSVFARDAAGRHGVGAERFCHGAYYSAAFGASDSLGAGTVASDLVCDCLLYTSPSPRDRQKSRMPSSA